VKINAVFPECAILLMGNLNETHIGAQRLASMWPGTFKILMNDGKVPTVCRNSGRTVDHICFFTNGLLAPGRGRVTTCRPGRLGYQ